MRIHGFSRVCALAGVLLVAGLAGSDNPFFYCFMLDIH